MLALFGERIRPEPRPLPDPALGALTALAARRRQLIEMLVAERHRRSQVQDATVRHDIAQHIRWLERRLAQATRDIGRLLETTPAWRVKDQLLRSAPGIGPTTAAVFIGQLPELGTLTVAKSPPSSVWPRLPVTAAPSGRSTHLGGPRQRPRGALHGHASRHALQSCHSPPTASHFVPLRPFIDPALGAVCAEAPSINKEGGTRYAKG